MNDITPMEKRPLSVTVIGALFFIAGAVGVAYHATEFRTTASLQGDLLWVLLVRLLAVVGAVFLFRGANWARWLLVLWMAYHVALSFFHAISQVVVHSIFLAVIAYFLFRPAVSSFFQKPPAHVRMR